MQHYQDVVLDRAGNAIAGAIITVTDHVIGTPALLYSDYAGTIPQTTTVTDANGSYSFYTNVTRCDFAMYRNGKLLKTVNDAFTNADIGPIGPVGPAGATDISSYQTASSIPVPYTGVARVGTKLYTGNGGTSCLVNDLALKPNDVTAATANALLLQSAINAGGLISIQTPGVYYVGDSLEADLYVSIFLKSNIEINLGQGVYLTQNTQDKSFFANSNYQSPQVPINIAGVTITYPTTGVNAGSTVVTIPTTGSVAHGLSIGDPVYIKNDTALQIAGVWFVDSVPTTSSITIVMNGFTSVNPLNLPTGSPVMHKCNVNIKLTGDGVIDYNNKNTVGTLPNYPATGYGLYNGVGNGNTQHGTILNKVGFCKIAISTKDCRKYGVYFCNAVSTESITGVASTKSSPIQWNGPCWDVLVKDSYGGTGDDFIPFITSNIGYESYDLLDVGGGTAVRGSDGEFRNIKIYNASPKSGNTRSIILAATTSNPITNVYIESLSNSSLTDVYGQAAILLAGAGTSSIKGLVISSINYCFPASLTPTTHWSASPIIATNGTAGDNIDLQMSIGTIVVKGENANGNGGVSSDLITLGQDIRTVDCIIGSIVADASAYDRDVNIINLANTGKTRLSVSSMVINQTATGNWVYGIRCNSLTASNITVGSIIMTGANCCPFTENGVDGNIINCNSVIVNSTNSGSIHNSYKASTFNYGTVVFNGANSAGLFRYMDVASTVICSLSISNYSANCDYQLRLEHSTTANPVTLNLALLSGNNTHGSANFLTTNSLNQNKIVLKGPVVGGRIEFNGTNDIHATVANHASGGYFYNNAAGYATGVGVYMKGSTTFTKIAA